MIYNVFRWSKLSPDRKDAVLGVYVWGILAILVFIFSSDGLSSNIGLVLAICSVVCLLLSIFASERVLERVLWWMNWPWPPF